jgi:hypothetical protein
LQLPSVTLVEVEFRALVPNMLTDSSWNENPCN